LCARASRCSARGGTRRESWDLPHDREPRAALCAVDERVPVAAVGGIEQFAQALVAGGDVRRDERRARAADAGLDYELAVAAHREPAGEERIHARQGRCLADESRREGVDGAGLALGLDHQPAPVVEHEAPQLVVERQPVNEGPEPHPLHQPADPEPAPLEDQSGSPQSRPLIEDPVLTSRGGRARARSGRAPSAC
jgi:hypothetical protein